jgi:hypothetical protein
MLNFTKFLVAIHGLIFGATLYGQNLSAPVNLPGNSAIGGLLSIGEVEYEAESNNGDFDIDRNVIGAEFHSRSSDSMYLYGHAGFTFDAERGSGMDDGQGALLGGGVRTEVHRVEGIKMYGYGGLNFAYESWDEPFEGSSRIFELLGGFSASFAGLDKLTPYAAVEIYPYSDGTIEYEISTPVAGLGRDFEFDYERDSFAVLKLGLLISLRNLAIRPEISLLGENQFILSILSVN